MSISGAVTEIWSNDAPRCVDTVQPLADSLGLPVRPFGAGMMREKNSDVVGRLKASTAPGWAVVCARSIDLDILEDQGLLPGCSRALASCYERYMTFAGQTVTNREYSLVDIWAHGANIVYPAEQLDAIQKKT